MDTHLPGNIRIYFAGPEELREEKEPEEDEDTRDTLENLLSCTSRADADHRR
jgi:hypothetical protein